MDGGHRSPAIVLLAAALALAGTVPHATTQTVVVRVAHLDDSYATMQRYERTGPVWSAIGEPVPARVGRNGVAWGRGLHAPMPGNQKTEGDGRAPMGVFALDSAYGFDATAPEGATWPYRHITAHDLWSEDPDDPLYNQHVVAPGVPGSRELTPYEQSVQMRQTDPHHALKVAVRHNMAPNIEPGAGSAIFLHIWRRDGEAPTAGCTSMARGDLEALVTWLRPEAEPVLVVGTPEVVAGFGFPSQPAL